MVRLSKIVDEFGSRIPVRVDRAGKSQELQANYDILHRENENDHWKYASELVSSAIDTYSTLQRLRRLSRHEFRNNPHLNGLTRKIAHEVVGVGPRLEILPDKVTKRSCKAATELEKTFEEHFEEILFTQNLRSSVVEEKIGGEVFSQFRVNRRLKVLPIDFEPLQGDQIHTPGYLSHEIQHQENYPPIDGIILDQQGNVVAYHKLKYHPNGSRGGANGPFNRVESFPFFRTVHSINEVDRVDAEFMTHEFRRDMPSQYRGAPETVPTLQVYAHIRRFIESKVTQEELRSKMLGTIQSNYSDCADIGDEPIEMFIGDGQFLTLPDGWLANLFKLDVTGQGVADFMRVALSWATQAFLTPWNIAASDSSDFNFASGRLDHLIWNRVVADKRRDIEIVKLNRYVRYVLQYASEMGRVPNGLGAFAFKWHWPEREPVDIKAQAQADTQYAKQDLLDMDKFAQRHGTNAIEMMKRKLRLKFEKERIKRELAKEYGFELPGSSENETGNDNNGGDGDTQAVQQNETADVG